MDRNKVLELAQQCQLVGMRPHLDGIYEQSLQQFAALIEREVIEDAEPVACIATNGALMWLQRPEALYSKPVPLFKHPAPDVDAEPVAYETDQELWAADDPDINDWIKQNGRPLYTPPTPAVVRQLVDALTGIIDFIEIDNLKIDQDALRIAKAALAAAKETGL